MKTYLYVEHDSCLSSDSVKRCLTQPLTLERLYLGIQGDPGREMTFNVVFLNSPGARNRLL